MTKKIVFLELNEVPHRVFVDSFKTCNYIRDIEDFDYCPTKSYDSGSLSPWITWATVHRGVTNDVHGIRDINQDCSEIDKKHPQIWNKLLDKNLKVGVFSSMHSSSVSEDEFDRYEFFVPEAFASSFICKPSSLKGLQSLNIIMSRASARVVSKKLPSPYILLKAIISYLRHPFRGHFLLCLFKQFISELIKPWTKIRRRTLQSDILFDVYVDLLYKTNPNFSSFFTNHVASSMHRFWEASYPNDYEKNISNFHWLNRYKNEISKSMDSTAYYINTLVKYVDSAPDRELWIVSSMGQAAVNNYKPKTFFWKILSLSEFFYDICRKQIKIHALPQMIPIYSIKSDKETINLIHNSILALDTNSKLVIRSVTETTIAFLFKTDNLETIWYKDKNTDNVRQFKGVSKVSIDEKTGSSAYHVPNGILYRYGENLMSINSSQLDAGGFMPTHKISNLLEESLDN